jgi:hypothetical protein
MLGSEATDAGFRPANTSAEYPGHRKRRVMPVAWITGSCDFDGTIAGKPFHREGRMTAVLANHGGRWLFEQVHFSVPDQ